MNGDYQEASEPGNVLGIPAPLFFSPGHYTVFAADCKLYFPNFYDFPGRCRLPDDRF